MKPCSLDGSFLIRGCLFKFSSAFRRVWSVCCICWLFSAFFDQCILTGPTWVATLVVRAVYKPFTSRLATSDWRRNFIFCIRIHVVVGYTWRYHMNITCTIFVIISFFGNVRQGESCVSCDTSSKRTTWTHMLTGGHWGPPYIPPVYTNYNALPESGQRHIE
jgi:hypothetical protein